MSSSTPDVRTAWEREYAEVHAYTTSYRDELDRGVQYLLGYLAGSDNLAGPVLECACGRGRNALPMAAMGHRVVGLDHARSALAQFRRRAGEEDLVGRSLPVAHDLRQPLPVRGEAVGTVLDITAVDNLIDAETRRRYGLEVARVLRPGGLAAVVTFDLDDGYYAPFLATTADALPGVVEDPHTGIRNQLFRAVDLDRVFCPPLERLAGNRFDFVDEAAKERWTRRFHLRLYRKPASGSQASPVASATEPGGAGDSSSTGRYWNSARARPSSSFQKR